MIKKIFASLVLVFIAFSVFAPLVAVKAQGVMNQCTLVKKFKFTSYTCDPAKSKTCSENSCCSAKGDEAAKIWGTVCLINTLYRITGFVSFIIFALAAAMITYGGLLVTTSQGDETQWEKGKSIISYALIGIVIGVLARAIPSIALMVVG